MFAEADSAGCGRPGSEIVLWTYQGDPRLSSTAVPWPDGGETATFDATFLTAAPMGTAKTATELAGSLRRRPSPTAPGARVEALVGDTVAGRTTRQNGDFTGFPSRSSVRTRYPVAIGRRDRLSRGRRATSETLTNDGAVHRSFDLTLS